MTIPNLVKKQVVIIISWAPKKSQLRKGESSSPDLWTAYQVTRELSKVGSLLHDHNYQPPTAQGHMCLLLTILLPEYTRKHGPLSCYSNHHLNLC